MRIHTLLIVGLAVIGLEAQREKAGTCPNSGPLTDFDCPFNSEASCLRDNDCAGDNKCCGCPRMCVEPRGPALPRVGNCPVVFEVPASVCARRGTPNTCSRDRDCPNRQTCCPTECGGRSCQSTDGLFPPSPPLNPNQPLPGIPNIYNNQNSCPAVDESVDCRARFPPFECTFSNDCDGREICCPTECGGRVCRRSQRNRPTIRPSPRPTQRRNKSCPIKVPRRLPQFCATVSVIADCFADRDCSGSRICCPPSRCGGGQCVTPPQRRCPKTRRRKPKYCARVRVGFLCSKDSDCAGSKRCCPGICGGRSCV